MESVVSNKCLVLGTEPRVALAISRCLSKYGIKVEAAIPKSMVFASRSINRIHTIEPLEDAEAVVLQLTTLFNGEKIVLFPTNDLALGICLSYRERLQAQFILGIPRQDDAISAVLDKEITLDAGQKLGIRVPQSVCSSDLSVIGSTLSYPMIAKPRTKFTEVFERVHYIRTLEELEQTKQTLSAPTEHYIFQEYVAGKGIGIELLMHEGSSLIAFQHERIEEFPCTGGISVLAKAVVLNISLVEQSVNLLRQMKWEGAAMVEYRLNPETGETILMEVNGRYWGSLALSLEAGLEFPYYHWQLLTGSVPNIPSNYIVGAKICWTAGRVERLARYISDRPQSWLYDSSILKELFRFVYDLPPFTRDAVWRFNDPVTVFYEFRHALRKLFRFIPKKLRIFLKLNIHAKVEYIKLHILALLKQPVGCDHISRVQKILFVCHGNIIRSAFANQYACESGLNSSSAGTHATATRADSVAINVAIEEFNVALDKHIPKKVTQAMLEQADLVLAMDYVNLANLRSSFSEVKDTIFLMGDFLAGRYSTSHEVQDPFEGCRDDFVESFNKIRDLIKKLIQHTVVERV